MAAKPLTSEAIALTEKKINMTLDDIIKMSKTNVSKPKRQRVSNRNQKFVRDAARDKSAKVQRFMDTRSSLRQGALARRRSNFQGNQFPLATEAARRAAVAPIQRRAFSQSRPNVNKPRVWAPAAQKNAANGGGFKVKDQWQQFGLGTWAQLLCNAKIYILMQKLQEQVKVVPKQKSQTLDSRFANMKEQRMRVFSQKNNGSRRNGGGQPTVPWVRGRFGN